jgi:hypothetical protein
MEQATAPRELTGPANVPANHPADGPASDPADASANRPADGPASGPASAPAGGPGHAPVGGRHAAQHGPGSDEDVRFDDVRIIVEEDGPRADQAPARREMKDDTDVNLGSLSEIRK